MGFRFRRSVRILPGLRFNFSKSGISTSIGGRGASINFSKRGTRTTVGIPGTGLSYSEMTPASHGPETFEHAVGTGSAGAKPSGCYTFLVVGLLIALFISIKSAVSSDPAPEAKGRPVVVELEVTPSSLNCRAGPRKSAPRLIKLVQGQVVKTADHERQNGWVKLAINDQICWADGRYLAAEQR